MSIDDDPTIPPVPSAAQVGAALASAALPQASLALAVAHPSLLRDPWTHATLRLLLFGDERPLHDLTGDRQVGCRPLELEMHDQDQETLVSVVRVHMGPAGWAPEPIVAHYCWLLLARLWLFGDEDEPGPDAWVAQLAECERALEAHTLARAQAADAQDDAREADWRAVLAAEPGA